MKKILFIFVLLSLGISSSFAQNILNGTVVDKEGNPVPGVKVKPQGRKQFVISNLDGTFHIDSKKPVRKIKLTYPGFKEDKYKVHSNMVVKMKKSNWWNEKPERQFFIGPQMGHMVIGVDDQADRYCPAAGFMLGWGGKVKIYTKFLTNMYYPANADFKFSPLENSYNDRTSYHYAYTNMSYGFMIHLKCPIYFYGGILTQGERRFYTVKDKIFYEPDTYPWMEYEPSWFEYTFDLGWRIGGECGLMMTFRHFFVNVGMTILDGANMHYGLGIMF